MFTKVKIMQDLSNKKLDTLSEDIGFLKLTIDILLLNNNELTILPESIGDLILLKNLNLSNNKIQFLPNNIYKLVLLRTLNLSSNKLNILPDSILYLTNLTELILSNNKLTELSSSIGNLNHLTELRLNNNKLNTLPESIGNLTSLSILEIENNKLTTLPNSIGNLTVLTSFGLKNNKLTTLPYSIGNLPNLLFKEFTLLPNSYTGLYSNVFNEDKLKKIIIDTFTLQSNLSELIPLEYFLIPDFIDKNFEIYDPLMADYTNLGDFFNDDENNCIFIVSSKKTDRLYDGFGFSKSRILESELQSIVECNMTLSSAPYLTQIKDNKVYKRLGFDFQNTPILSGYLNSVGNSYSTLYESRIFLLEELIKIEPVTSLESLIIYSNDIGDPTNIYGRRVNIVSGMHCSSGQDITCYNKVKQCYYNNIVLPNKHISTLHQSIGNLILLENIDLHNNNLNILPESIGNLKTLKVLDISRNNLISLPESIGSIVSLTYINLDNNSLTTLPESIGSILSLKVCNLNNNNLISLPNSIGNLIYLQSLYLNKNRLINLPESIGNLEMLEVLDISQNDLITLPESIGNLKTLEVLDISRNDLTELPKSVGNLPNLLDDKIQLLPNFYSGMYKSKNEIILKNKLINIFNFSNKMKENISLEYIQLLNFNTLNFIIKTRNGNEIMTDFLNLDSNNCVIIYQSFSYGKIYDGFGFNKKTDNTFIIECIYNKKYPIFKNLKEDNIYHKNSGVKIGYMNSLYNSNYSIFFADEKIIINRFLTFNENITSININNDRCINNIKINIYNKLYIALLNPIKKYKPSTTE